MRNFSVRTATADDLGPARAIMLDTVYHDFGTGYVPRWHGDIVDLEGAYLLPPRHTLLVAVASPDDTADAADADGPGGPVVATAALDSRGPAHPPNPRWIADRFPSGETAQLRRVYVKSAYRRHGIARRLVAELLRFAAADGGYRSVYLHTDPAVPGAEGFWRSLGTEVHDERTEPGESRVVHFEVATVDAPPADRVPADRATAPAPAPAYTP